MPTPHDGKRRNRGRREKYARSLTCIHPTKSPRAQGKERARYLAQRSVIVEQVIDAHLKAQGLKWRDYERLGPAATADMIQQATAALDQAVKEVARGEKLLAWRGVA